MSAHLEHLVRCECCGATADVEIAGNTMTMPYPPHRDDCRRLDGAATRLRHRIVVVDEPKTKRKGA